MHLSSLLKRFIILIVPEKLNCCPVLLGIPRLGLGLAGRLDNDPDADAVEFEVAMASIEPPLPRTSFIFSGRKATYCSWLM